MSRHPLALQLASFAVLALATVLPSCVHAATRTQPAPAFASETDCFATTPTYASWIESLAAKPGDAPIDLQQVARVVPERMFELARTAFECRVVTYVSDGHTVSGYVVLPVAPHSGGKRPLLVYNRGGNGSLGRIDSGQLFKQLLPLAKAGYVVVASQYRGDEAPGVSGSDEFGGGDVDDVMRLMDIALARPDVDRGNIFMLGASRGGMMNYLVADRRNDIRAMATIAAPTDLAAGLKRRPEMERVYSARIPGYATDPQRALESRSALHWVERLPATLPILLLHGDADDRVHVDDSRAMAARLARLGRPHRLVVYAGDSHSLQINRMQAHLEVLGWFKQHQR